MTRCLALLLLCCLPLSTLAQGVPPPAAATTPTRQLVAPQADPARQALDAWLAAFNSNEREQLDAFRDRYQSTMDVDGMLDFHHRTGGFRLLRREPAAPGSAQMLVQERDSDTVARVKATLQMGKPLAKQGSVCTFRPACEVTPDRSEPVPAAH